MELERKFINFKAEFRLMVFYHPIDIYNICRVLQNGLYLLGYFYLFFIIRTINFCDQSRQYRRSWRYFNQFYIGTIFFGNLLNLWTHGFGNVMTL